MQTTTHKLLLLAAILSILTAPACSSETGGEGSGIDAFAGSDLFVPTDSNVGDNDTGATATDTASPEDTATAVDTGSSGASTDSGSSSGGPDIVNTECPGAPGCACKDNADCDNGLCIEDVNVDNEHGKVCAKTCVDACDKGYKCVQASAGGGDQVSLCVPAWGRLCHPCSESKQCESLGITGSACVDQGDLGNFCGAPCTADGDCDEGFGCKDIKSVEGAASKQCVPKASAGSSDAFGACFCSVSATKQKLTTTCAVQHKDGKGNVVGTCIGERSCLATGLGKCVAPELAKEVCDGKDNDCNGKTDEATCDDKDACTVDACDAKAAKCTTTPVSDGLPCDADGTVCTESDSCQGGKCTAGKVLNCDDSNPCTTDTCDLAKGCTQVNADGKACNDDNPCTIGDICAAGGCKAGVPKVCTSTNPCILSNCSATDGGKCKLKNALNGLPCDDGNACTDKDACDEGTCSPKAITDCEDGNICSEDSCDKAKGCVYKDNNKPCADGSDKCVTGKQCKDTLCAGGTPKDCDDKKACTVDSCDSKSGDCKHDAKEADGKDCDDGDACTGEDKCTSGACKGTAGKGCDDGKPCTIDSCDKNTGKCSSDPAPMNGKACDADSDGCTIDDVCNAGNCVAGAKAKCDKASGACQKDLCSSTGANSYACKVEHIADGDLCDDGSACTKTDKCSGGACKGADALACDDSNLCTDDSCDPAKGCVYKNNTKPCPDNSKCTIKEVCDNGSCKKDALTCDDGNACTKNDCDAAKGCIKDNVDDQITCSQDGKKWCKAGVCEVKPDPNKGPVGKLSCPAGGFVGDTLAFDASASVDPDGTIASYYWDFGDGKQGGAPAKTSHAYSKDGTFSVTVVVTDNKGAKGNAVCKVNIAKKPANPPVVDMLKPTGNFAATQGEVVDVIVDVTPKNGKSIKSVQLLVGGKVAMTDTSLPYSFKYTVPANAKTGSQHSFQAQATDSEGSVGQSKAYVLTVKNDKPVAAFSATVTGKLKVAVDAGYSKDTETPTDKLQVRFDWENDGTFDTVWQTTKKLEFTYGKEGTYTIKMQVKDQDGQVSETTRKVALSLVKQVSGTVNTTTWTGTIIITGDITVPKGQVLTVAEGTSVLFVPVDQNKDNIGDFDIWVHGKLNLQGTANAPVTVSTYGTKKSKARDWGRIQLKGEGSSIANAIIEYGYYGVEIADKSTVKDTSFRNNKYGIWATSGSAATFTNVTATENGADGVTVNNGAQLTINGGSFDNNGRHGAHLNGASNSTALTLKKVSVSKNANNHGIYVRSTTTAIPFSLLDSTVKSNGGAGVQLVGGLKGDVMRNNILYNSYEGVRWAAHSTYDMTVKVNHNNIFGNALKGAWAYKKLSVSAAKTGYGSGTATSSVWATPKGEKLEFVRFSYSETDYYKNYYVEGRLRADSSSGTVMHTTKSNLTAQWLDVSSFNRSKLVAQVYKSTSSSSYNGTASIQGAVYTQAGLKREISVIHHSKGTDWRKNFYGVFPDVLSVMTLSSPTAANVHGFVGKAFDDKWDVGPYRGGESITKPETWPATTWITGDISISSIATVTVQAGSKVHMVRHDQDSNGVGDFDLYVAGKLNLLGKSGAPVTVSSLASKQTPGKDWERIRLKGKNSTIQWAIVEFGEYGLEIEDASAVSDTIARKNRFGLTVRAPGNVSVSNLTATQNTSIGLLVSSGGKTQVTGASITANLGDGAKVTSTSTATSVTIDKSDLSKNNGRGLRVESGSSGMVINLSNSTVKSNGRAGVSLRGGMTGTIQRNNILYNGNEGVRAAAWSVYDVQVKINHNNIFGNALKGAWAYQGLALTASKTGYGSGTATSSAWGTPKGENIELFRWTYSETDYYKNYYVEGRVRRDSSGGSILVSTKSNLSSRWHDSAESNVKKLVTQTYKSTSSSSYNGTTTVQAAVWTQAGLKRELSAIALSKTLDAKHNYFGVFPDILQVITMSSSSAVDLHGFVGKAFDDTWSKGVYYGGEISSKDVAWSGEVYVTGDFIIPTGKKLSVSAGTKVNIVKYDVAKDGVGDIDLTINGALNIAGTKDKPVTFVEHGGKGAKGSWHRIRVAGSQASSSIQHATFSHAYTALVLESGNHSLGNAAVTNSKHTGVLFSNATKVSGANVAITGSGTHGLHIHNSGGISLDQLTTNQSGQHGVNAYNSKSNVKITNLRSTNNGGSGMYAERSSPVVSLCDLTGNQVGAWWHKDSAGSVTRCNLKGNKSEGALLTSADLLQPKPVINDCNIFENGTVDGAQIGTMNVSATKTGYGSGTATSAVWTSPYYDSSKKSRAVVLSLLSSYSETDYYKNYYVEGRVRRDSSSGTALFTHKSSVSSRWAWMSSSSITKLVAQVYKSTSSSSYKGTMTMSKALYRLAGKKVELAAVTDSGTVNCKNNYWGGFADIDKKMTLSRTNAIDFQGFAVLEKPAGAQ